MKSMMNCPILNFDFIVYRRQKKEVMIQKIEDRYTNHFVEIILWLDFNQFFFGKKNEDGGAFDGA